MGRGGGGVSGCEGQGELERELGLLGSSTYEDEKQEDEDGGYGDDKGRHGLFVDLSGDGLAWTVARCCLLFTVYCC